MWLGLVYILPLVWWQVWICLWWPPSSLVVSTKDSIIAVSCSILSLWPRAIAPTSAWDTYMDWNWSIMWLAMVAFNWLSQILRVVGISCSKSYTLVHILGIWVSGKQSRPCNNGFGGLDCIWMWRSLWLVALSVNMLKTCTSFRWFVAAIAYTT